MDDAMPGLRVTTVQPLAIPPAAKVYAIRLKTGEFVTGYTPDQGALQDVWDDTPSIKTATHEIVEKPNA